MSSITSASSSLCYGRSKLQGLFNELVDVFELYVFEAPPSWACWFEIVYILLWCSLFWQFWCKKFSKCFRPRCVLSSVWTVLFIYHYLSFLPFLWRTPLYSRFWHKKVKNESNIHCIKNVQLRNLSSPYFPTFELSMENYTESKSSYSVVMLEDTDQKVSEYGHFLRSDL